MSINVCNDRSMASITSLPSGVTGSSLVLISEQTASSSSTISFTSGIDSTYKEYIFKFINLHPSEASRPQFNLSADGGSNYNVTKTTTFFASFNDEAGSSGAVSYSTGGDLAQSTGVQRLGGDTDADNDTAMSGTLHLFDPSNTTFVKHFICTTNFHHASDLSLNNYVAGYCNVTAAIDGVQFSFSSGNIGAGTFKLYGVV